MIKGRIAVRVTPMCASPSPYLKNLTLLCNTCLFLGSYIYTWCKKKNYIYIHTLKSDDTWLLLIPYFNLFPCPLFRSSSPTFELYLAPAGFSTSTLPTTTTITTNTDAPNGNTASSRPRSPTVIDWECPKPWV